MTTTDLTKQAGLASLGVTGVGNVGANYLTGTTIPLGLAGNISSIANSYMMPGASQANLLPLRNYAAGVKRLMPQIPTAPFDIEGNIL